MGFSGIAGNLDYTFWIRGGVRVFSKTRAIQVELAEEIVSWHVCNLESVPAITRAPFKFYLLQIGRPRTNCKSTCNDEVVKQSNISWKYRSCDFTHIYVEDDIYMYICICYARTSLHV